jgi:hypothetical protein
VTAWLPPGFRIVSGAQTGVDRAALDVAIALGIGCGGWVPRGRLAEDGPVPGCYPVRETRERTYATRTRLNVRDADATLILCRGRPSGGTALTIDFAERLAKPYRIVDLDAPEPAADTRAWIAAAGVRVLNVAGPRESSSPGIGAAAAAFLEDLLADRGPSPLSG